MSKYVTFKNWIDKRIKEQEVKLQNPFNTYPDASKQSVELFTIVELTVKETFAIANQFQTFNEVLTVFGHYLKQVFRYHYIDEFGNMKTKISADGENYVLREIESYKISTAQQILAYAKKLRNDEIRGTGDTNQLKFGHE